MKITGIHHVALRSRDFDQSLDFYTRVLGLKVRVAWDAKPRRAMMLDAGDGNYIEVFERPDSQPVSSARGMDTAGDVVLHLALRVDDCGGMLEKLRAAGVHVAMETKDVKIANTATGGTGQLPPEVPVRIAFFNGPDGELVELFENALT